MSKKKDEFVLRKNRGTAFTFTGKDGTTYFQGDFNYGGVLHTAFGKVTKCKNGNLHLSWGTKDAVEAEIEEGQRKADSARDRATKIEQ